MGKSPKPRIVVEGANGKGVVRVHINYRPPDKAEAFAVLRRAWPKIENLDTALRVRARR